MPKLRFTYLFRVILLAVLAGSVTASCNRRHKVVVYDEIVLGANSVGTKALVTDKPSLINLSYNGHTGFGVYGYKSVTSRSYTYRQFENIMVYPSSGDQNATWTYSPKRYWDSDPNASYQFAAYWPYLDGTGATTVSETGIVLTINNIPNWQDEANGGNDYLVAARRGKYRDANSQNEVFPNGYVNFNFEHILANIYIRGYYIGIQDNPVNILSMELSGSNMLTTDGNNDYTLPFAGQVSPAKGFDTPTTGNGSHTLLSDTNPVTLPTTAWYNDDENNPNQYEYEQICSWLVVPSTGWQNLDLAVTYSLGDINQNPAPTAITAAPVKISLNTTVNNQVQAGTIYPQYRYLVTLKFNSASKGIEVESIQVADWKDVTITPGVYNW